MKGAALPPLPKGMGFRAVNRMKSWIVSICFSFMLSVFSEELPNRGVTYTFSQGRLGDNILSYLHAKWVSYKYNIPLLYRTFPYSSDLVMDTQEIHFDSFQKNHFGKIIKMKDKKINLHSSDESVLYIVPYYAEAKYEKEHPKPGRPYFNVDWKDKGFRLIARKCIAPQKPLRLLSIPTDCITIAVHVREGGGFDSRKMIDKYFWKLPPLSFYIDSLRKVVGMFSEKKIYCYLFTDAQDPCALVKKIQQEMPQEISIFFDYRKDNNRHDTNVLEDFFSFFLFDVLIRSDSNFSLVPSLLNDYAVLVTPEHFTQTTNHEIIVDQLNISINQETYQKLLTDPKYKR
jgi:hypothetical protein